MNGYSWNTITDNNHPSNSYLTSGIIKCGRVNFSTEVNGPCTITFDWRKTGEYGILRCYYDNIFDPINSPICGSYKWTPGTIRIPPGHHTVTWDFMVRICNEAVGNVADIDNINVLSINVLPINPPPRVIKIPSEANLSYIVNALKAPYYEVDVASGANLQAVIDNSANKVIYLDGRFKGPINITVDNIKIKLGNTFHAELDGGNKLWNIGIDNRTNVSIEGLNLKNSLNGIKMEKCSQCRISSNSIEFSKGSGICVRNSTDTNIIEYNNIISTSGLTNNAGICLHNSNDNRLTNNKIFTAGFCITLEHSYGNMISILDNDRIYDSGIMCRVNNCRIECENGSLNGNSWSCCV